MNDTAQSLGPILSAITYTLTPEHTPGTYDRIDLPKDAHAIAAWCNGEWSYHTLTVTNHLTAETAKVKGIHLITSTDEGWIDHIKDGTYSLLESVLDRTKGACEDITVQRQLEDEIMSLIRDHDLDSPATAIAVLQDRIAEDTRMLADLASALSEQVAWLEA